MNERRREKRIMEEDRVTIEYLSEDGSDEKKTRQALTQDISIGGARIVTDRSFDVGAQFQITMTLSKSKQILKVPGQVKWIREISEDELFEIGVEFLHGIPKTVLLLIAHLYGQAQEVRSSIRA